MAVSYIHMRIRKVQTGAGGHENQQWQNL